MTAGRLVLYKRSSRGGRYRILALATRGMSERILKTAFNVDAWFPNAGRMTFARNIFLTVRAVVFRISACSSDAADAVPGISKSYVPVLGGRYRWA